MLRVLIAALLGAVVYFMWGFVAWGVVGIYDFAFFPIENEQSMRLSINETLDESGAYVIPYPPENISDEEEVKKFTSRHTTGPLVMILFNKDGTDPMSPVTFIRGFGVELLAALILCMLLSWGKIDSYGGRVSFIFFASLFAVITTHAVQWNFFYHPPDYTFALMMDPIVGWLLAGFVMAAIVKPQEMNKAEE